MKASAAMRRLPSSALASGSWASVITSELTRKITPMPFSDTPASFFANTGRSSKIA